jgi:hypothetical protein
MDGIFLSMWRIFGLHAKNILQGFCVTHKYSIHAHYRNLNLELATKARACKSAGQEGSPGVTFHAPRSVKECEGMNPHTFKGTPTLGVGLPMDSQIFRERLQRSKHIRLRRSLYHWKALKT